MTPSFLRLSEVHVAQAQVIEEVGILGVLLRKKEEKIIC
jgi:hypothetical protein